METATEEPMISTVTRLHDGSCIPIVREAIFSLAIQGTPIESILVCQDFADAALEQLTRDTRPYEAFLKIRILNVGGLGAGDWRSRLLNEGVRAATGRYLTFLDYDDVVYPSAFRRFKSFLEKNENLAIVIGNAVMAEVYFVNNRHYCIAKRLRDTNKVMPDLSVDNFAPIHSYMIDLARVSKADITFDEEMSVLEDYHFLLRLAAKYNSAAALGMTVCEYRMRQSHTVKVSRERQDYLTPSLIEGALAKIDELKRSVGPRLTYTQLSALRDFWLGHPSSGSSGVAIEALREEQRRLRRSMGALLRVFGRSIESPDALPVWDCGFLESEETIGANKRRISGWIVDKRGKAFSGELFYHDGGLNFEAIEVTRERGDIEKALDVRLAGFYKEIEKEIEAGSPPLLLVYHRGTVYKLKELSSGR